MVEFYFNYSFERSICGRQVSTLLHRSRTQTSATANCSPAQITGGGGSPIFKKATLIKTMKHDGNAQNVEVTIFTVTVGIGL